MLKTPQTYISLSGGVKLLGEDFYIAASGNEWSKGGFRALCRNLNVPMIEIGKVRYVDMHVFEMAMVSITRIGQSNFYTPGCDSTGRGRERESKADLEQMRHDWAKVLRDLIRRRKINEVEASSRVREAARQGARRLLEMGVHLAPTNAQAAEDRRGKDPTDS